MASRLFNQIDKILYTLERDFGTALVIVRESTSAFNTITGKSTIDVSDQFTLKRAIVLEGQTATKFAYDLSYVAANKDFTYGGYFDTSKRLVVLRGRSMTRAGYTPQQQDIFQINNIRYNIKKMSDTVNGRGYLFIIEGLTNDNAV